MKGISSWLTGKTGSPTTNSTERPSSSRTTSDTTFVGDSIVAPTPSSSHSVDSPSPSPQPQTPDDTTAAALPAHSLYFGDSAHTPSKPIGIAAPQIRPSSSSASPVQRILTPDGRVKAIDGTTPPTALFSLPDDNQDVDMTTGPNLEPGFGRSRHDSFVSAGPKPISMNPNRDQGARGRRESLAGSLLNGMSWGGISVGSYIRDDMAMTGTSPFMGAQSPHSNSYVPKMEAEFLRNFLCCDQRLETMHDLLRHYETVHTNANPQAARPTSVSMGGHRLSVSRSSVSNQGGRRDSLGFQSQGQFGLSQQNRNVTSNGNGLGFGGIQMGRQQSGMGGSQKAALMDMHGNDEMDAVGDMEMDDAVGPLELDDSSQRTIQQTRQMFGQQQRPQLSLNLSGTGMSQQALRTSQPSTPSSFGFQNNPTVSSVNTPTLTTTQSQDRQLGAGGSSATDDGLSGLGSNLNLNDFSAFGANINNFIDNPAKQLYSPNNAVAQQRLQQQMAQFGLDQSQFGDITDPHQIAILQRALGATNGTLVMPPEEDKPFKCPVIGCEKAYKNQNGLKYHKQHGHQTQQLHENGDGTFSIVNPETSTPYPGEMGMEKEKPHKCEYCNKRYKNLNGLKYHKQHSPACEAAAQVAAIKAGWANNGSGPMNLNMSMSNISLAMSNFNNLNTTNLSNIMSNSMSNGMSGNLSGLPDIGEDMQM